MTANRTYQDFYANVETAAPMTRRLEMFLEDYELYRAERGEALDVLDIGCGRQAHLSQRVARGDRYLGCDIHVPAEVELHDYLQIDLNVTSLLEAVGDRRFDVVFCGEVVEHLFSPDALLRDLRRVLRPGGIVVLSTPNLAYWLNRVLLLVGISPLFLENSSEVKLGRRVGFLGQGNEAQGHIRLFTHRALLELAKKEGFDTVRARGVPVWNFFVDRAICRVSRHLAPDNVVVFRPSADAPPA